MVGRTHGIVLKQDFQCEANESCEENSVRPLVSAFVLADDVNDEASGSQEGENECQSAHDHVNH